MKVITQNGQGINKQERLARQALWLKAIEDLEASLGKPTPENIKEFAAALEEADKALPTITTEADFPLTSPEDVKALLEQTGGYALVLEVQEDTNEVVGVVYIAS
jgi:hypothetical protein